MTALQTVPQQTSLMPSMTEWQIIKEQAGVLVKSGFLPNAIKTPEQAIAVALKGRELGIPMMQAFAHIAVIQGKPTMSAELMLAQIFKHVPGAKINYQQYDSQACIIEAIRPGSKPLVVSFSIEDAKKADLTGKDNWHKYARAMLRSRCISEMARAMFPDALQGVSYTPEELAPDMPVSESGEIIDMPAVQATPLPKPSKTRAAPRASQPAPEVDKAPEQVAQTSGQSEGLTPDELQHLMNYTVPFGKKLKGLKVIDCDMHDLKSYAEWLLNSAMKDGKPLSVQAREFVTVVCLFERQMQHESTQDSGGAVIVSASQDIGADIPF